MFPAEAISLLYERVARPGLLGIHGKKVERQCELDLRAYFETLAKRVDALDFSKFVTQDRAHALNAVDVTLHNVIRTMTTSLTSTLAINLMQGYLAGSQHTKLKEADATLDYSVVDKLGPSGEAAATYAAKKSAKLVTDINNTTRKIIRDAVSTAIEDQLGVPSAARAIRQAMSDMTKLRSRTIARTEMNAAWSQASLDKMKRTGTEYKQIVLSPDACEICQDNADSDPIPVGDEYPSGDLVPPFHPNCRCAVTDARSPEED